MAMNLFLNEHDYYETRLASLVSDLDREILINLYQPLIGHQAMALYLSLYLEKVKSLETSLFSHAHLFNKLQMSGGQLLDARKLLEGVGLVRSFFKEENDIKFYIYVLYAPKSPKDFFDDALFKGLLIKYVGEKEAMRLASHYALETKTKGYEEVSASFPTVFHNDLDDPAFLKPVNVSLKGHQTRKVQTEFVFEEFLTHFENRSQLKRKVFLKRELKEIERLATLYGLNESTMADIIIEAYNPQNKEQKINFSYVTKRAIDEAKYPFLQTRAKQTKKSVVSNETQLASKIKLMENVSPSDYLRIKQNNTTPSNADLNLVNNLSKNFNLSNGVINALIDYVLIKLNNVLSRNYIEKIAASLAREQVETAVDAMNYLLRVNDEQKAPVKRKAAPKKIAEKNDIIKEEISDEEIADIVSLIEDKKKAS